MKYLEQLDLKNRCITFGTEIEFRKAELNELSRKSIDLPVRLSLGHKTEFNGYDEWYIDRDYTVSEETEDKIYGGEISSKILNNSISDWKELKIICDRLESCEAYVDGNCSNHISIGTDSFYRDINFYKTLVKLLVIYEEEIIRFSYGEFSERRLMFNKFSRSLRFSLISKIKEYDVFKEEDYNNFMNLICYKEVELFTTRTGINLKEIDSKKRIEFKYPNGTINPVVIQNNINFFIKLVISIIENKIDVENLDYLISKIEIKDINFFCIKRAKSLCEVISDNETDRLNFMEQFEKVKRY